MKSPPTGRARQQLIENARHILVVTSPQPVIRLVANYIRYCEEEALSPSLRADYRRAEAASETIRAIEGVPADAFLPQFNATDGSPADKVKMLAESRDRFLVGLAMVQEGVQQMRRELYPREIKKNANRTVATDTKGSPDKRILGDCRAELQTAAQKIKTGPKGNVKRLARIIIEIATGDRPSLEKVPIPAEVAG